ncbi:tRNA lysidine(34) synthetase TilS [Afifella marina]|uniref:tRNA(Ile)-lysidine synthase n=1 Tax=Afifella marina DSM 2698 TaxID=1120955 RepID=A0A1G5P4A0_AFIMA|nr:tRNA lysidine(34) synthetase TilS [Afifella marina]MBK1625058.1 tRNA lysidine(34) synthetase TilS [Afifella marina DSM 2698]MBK1628762.1 tRNA lysidine(34) synthetase TilS [Afifella marina]MBK5918420.1 tRNA lysidine(34) synthetase TilS [Afifella marina]RAI19522.1 tRNA lysidine(34) synthetase TilS [Afifella marina DSM 2698]SCZ44383.1 tRNA(Ile)-lysidine synthase [Afifella marina DSM 2698]
MQQKRNAPAAEGAIDAAAAEPLLGDWLDRGALIAVSGGPDSMALMALAAEVAAGRGAPVPQVFTFDHGLRPESADEARMVGEVCTRLRLRHHVRRWDEAERPQSGIAAAARLARYAAAVDVATMSGCGSILTAHHADDQAETVLMRMARTAEPRALRGIEPALRREGWPTIARPFLQVSKARLRLSAEALELPFCDDPTNSDPAQERARVRLAAPELCAIGLTAERLSAFAAREGHLYTMFERTALQAAESGKVDEFGAITISRPFSMRREMDFEAWLALLRRLLMAASGRVATPSREALLSLDERATEGVTGGLAGVFAVTLHGACLHFSEDQLVVSREWGRQGPADQCLQAGRGVVFDGRYIVAPHALAGDGTLVRGFGRCGRGNPFERTMPALFAEDTCIAVPPLLAAKAEAGCRTDLSIRQIVEDRLRDPHIGGLYDRLMVENRLPPRPAEMHNIN